MPHLHPNTTGRKTHGGEPGLLMPNSGEKLAAEPPPMLVNFIWLQRQGILSNRMDLYRKRKWEGFPAPIELSRNKIAWVWEEVQAWLAARPRRTPKSGTKKITGAPEAVAS
jgi:hypothetical protein